MNHSVKALLVVLACVAGAETQAEASVASSKALPLANRQLAQQAPAPAAGTTPPATTAPAAPTAPAETTNPPKDPAQLPADGSGATPSDGDNGGVDAPADGAAEDFSLGDVPEVETVELTPDMARRALDAYVLVREKYKDADLENYENIQDFVDKNAQGKAFETDIKASGFTNVTDWDTAIATLGFAYSNIQVDQTADIKQQIEELKADTEMAQDMRDRMINALNAMIPSENNRKIVEELIKDPAYSEKIKLLETEDE